MGWIADAPRAYDFKIESAGYATDDGSVVPAVAFAFAAEGQKVISVALLGDVDTLRLFHREFMKHLSKAEHFARTKQKELDDARREQIRRNSEEITDQTKDGTQAIGEANETIESQTEE
jgi:hypothetical protein